MAVSLSELFNGERTVVVLFIIIIFFSLPISLLFHGVLLSLLTIFALYTEIRFETSSSSLSQFETRAGVSSGILLGAVTLPSLMLSKLIQQSRAFSLNLIQPEELNYLFMQHWAAFASCLAVLTFLLLFSSDKTRSRSFHGQDAKFALSCVVICVMLFFLYSTNGVHAKSKFLWELSHGFVAVKLVQHLLNTFPSCASIAFWILDLIRISLYTIWI